MVEVDEAQALLKGEMRPLASIRLPLRGALGRVMAANIPSPIDMPPFNRSAMDGYAIRHEDLEKQRGVELIGQADAGHAEAFAVGKGQACRIHTGAMIPEGADTVIRQEDVEAEGKEVRIGSGLKVSKGNNVRPRGEELREGEIALEAGTRLSPAGIAFLASLGISELEVHKRLRVGLLYTGDELTAPGDELPKGSIYESNSYGIEACLQAQGIHLDHKAHIPDDPEASKKMVGEALKICDLLLLSGGISVGDRDHVKEALMENEIEEVFHKVRQKLGKPIFFGKGRGKYAFGLPGNPAASLVGMYEYVLPFIRGSEGDPDPFPKRIRMPLKGKWEKPSDRHVFLKAQLERDGVRALEGQSSTMLGSFARADALISLSPGRGPLQEGEWVDVDLLEG